MDAVLVFDVLMYINVFYYPLFAVSHPIMIVAKFFSPNYRTPEWIEVDAAVVATLIIVDLLKIVLFRKIHKRVAAVIVAVALTCVSLSCILYIFVKQEKVMRMEYTICVITFILFLSEITFGIFQFVPCCKESPYK